MTIAAPDDLVAVGRVADAYGVHGWVKVLPYNAPQESVLRTARRWWLPDGRSVAVERSRVHGASIVGKPSDCSERNGALALKGLEISVSRADFPPGPSDEYYWVDLIGCSVANLEGEDLGVVQSVEDYGAHPILKTLAGDRRERMIPFVGVYIAEVDIAAKRIVADWQADF